MTEARLAMGLVVEYCPRCHALMEQKRIESHSRTKWFWEKYATITDKKIDEYQCPMCLQYKKTNYTRTTYTEVPSLSKNK